MEKKLQKLYPIGYNLLTTQNLWQTHYQILSLILLIHKIKCTNCDTCCLEYTNAKDDLVEYKCLCCDRNSQKDSDENLKAKYYINKFILLLQKDVYPYEYMGDWKKI